MGTCKRFLEKQKKSDCLLRPLDIYNCARTNIRARGGSGARKINVCSKGICCQENPSWNRDKS